MISVFGAFTLLGVSYLLFFNNNTANSSAVEQDTAAASDAEVVFLNLSTQLNSITFDTKVLSDPRFAALTDIHTAILPESEGKRDPFGTIGQ